MVLLLRAREDLRAMGMKGYSAFPKLQHYRILTIRQFTVISRTLVGGLLLFWRDVVVYSIASGDWAAFLWAPYDTSVQLYKYIHCLEQISLYFIKNIFRFPCDQ